MKQSQIILRFLLPPRQDAAEAVHPAMRSFHNPAPSFKASLMFDRLGFFASGSNVGCITKLLHQISYLTRIVSLIQRHTLRLFFCRFRTLYRNTFYRCLNHSLDWARDRLAVVPICSIDCQADRHTTCLGQQTSFNAFFGPIRRVRAGFSPRQAALLSWHRPSVAKTNQYLSTRHSLAEPVPTVSEKPRLGSTPGIGYGLCCWSKYRSHSKRSIDNQSGAQKEFHSWPCGRVASACHHRSDVYLGALVSVARFFPIIRLKSCICFLLFVFSSLSPFKGIIAFEMYRPFRGYSDRHLIPQRNYLGTMRIVTYILLWT